MIEHLRHPLHGYFYFQKTGRLTNRIPYMRWGQAWAWHALTAYAVRGSQSFATTERG